MSASNNFVPLSGSSRDPEPQSRVIGPVDPNQRLEVSVVLRPKASIEDMFSARQQASDQSPLSREEFEATYGADAQDAASVESFARSHGLEVTDTNLARRTVSLSGPASAFNEAFGVQLMQNEYSGGSYRGHSGDVYIPTELSGVIEGVFGLDDRPQASPHFRRYSAPEGVLQAQAGGVSYTPLEVASAYQFPSDINGTGQTIAIIELGGGYTQDDLTTYFTNLGLAVPQVETVSVDGAGNQPTGDPNGPDAEVMLDIEVAGAVANGARIVTYFAPNTDRGFLDAITTAVHDTTYRPSVISISWGGPESSWSAQSLQSFDREFQAAGAMGITVCCASGDSGSSDGVSDGQAHVDFPSSSPHVLGCGGTTLTVSNGSITAETVWNDDGDTQATGGGVSATFALPAWQANAGVPPAAGSTGNTGRGVPDVAGDADPQTGYKVRVNGQDGVVGGTSAVAPLWAALIALLNQDRISPLGFVNSVLYSSSSDSGAFRDITSGNNGAYTAVSGWDACTGLGSPDGTGLRNLLASSGTAPQRRA